MTSVLPARTLRTVASGPTPPKSLRMRAKAKAGMG
jgi:hypothetical protein